MASSMLSKAPPAFIKARSIFTKSSSGSAPSSGKQQKHHFASPNYFYSNHNKDIICRLSKQDKMIAKFFKDMYKVLKASGEVADKAFNIVYRTDHFVLKQKLLASDATTSQSDYKMALIMMRNIHEVEAIRAKQNLDEMRAKQNLELEAMRAKQNLDETRAKQNLELEAMRAKQDLNLDPMRAKQNLELEAMRAKQDLELEAMRAKQDPNLGPMRAKQNLDETRAKQKLKYRTRAVGAVGLGLGLAISGVSIAV